MKVQCLKNIKSKSSYNFDFVEGDIVDVIEENKWSYLLQSRTGEITTFVKAHFCKINDSSEE